MKLNGTQLRKIIKEVIDDGMSDEQFAQKKDVRTDLMKRTVEEYIGSPVTSVKVHADPQNAGVFAVRAVVGDHPEEEDYIIYGFSMKKSPQEMATDVGEAAFKTWPPTSSGR